MLRVLALLDTFLYIKIIKEKNLIPNDILLYFQDICQKAKKNEAGYIFGFPITKTKKFIQQWKY